jgi:phosphoribosylformylglycinamidine synthase subunit PurS
VSFRFEVVVMLKEGLADPQGKAIEENLPAMGWTGVSEVRVGRHVTLTVEDGTEEAARSTVDEIARRLLSNPVIEDFRVLSVEEAR